MSAAMLPARVRMRPDGTPEVLCGRRDCAANVMDPDEPRLLRPGFIWGADGAWSLSARAERQWAEAKRGDNALMVARARGLSMRDAAKAAGLSERTAYRRATDSDFRQQVSRARAALLAEAVGILADQSTAAARTLADLLSSPSDTVRLRAAVALLDSAMKGVEVSDIAERIAWLEDALAANLFEAPAEAAWRR